jgi:hypothetical protein
MELKVSKEIKDFIYNYLVEEHGYKYDEITDDDLFTILCDDCIYNEDFGRYNWTKALTRKVSKIWGRLFEWYESTDQYESDFNYEKEIVEVEPYEEIVIDYRKKEVG